VSGAKFRDVLFNAIGILVLVGAMLSLHPELRQRAAQMAADPQSQILHGVVGNAVHSGVAMLQGYAGDNSYQFFMVVAACVLFVLMLKVIA
jgi:hypothetical protein